MKIVKRRFIGSRQVLTWNNKDALTVLTATVGPHRRSDDSKPDHFRRHANSTSFQTTIPHQKPATTTGRRSSFFKTPLGYIASGGKGVSPAASSLVPYLHSALQDAIDSTRKVNSVDWSVRSQRSSHSSRRTCIWLDSSRPEGIRVGFDAGPFVFVWNGSRHRICGNGARCCVENQPWF